MILAEISIKLYGECCIIVSKFACANAKSICRFIIRQDIVQTEQKRLHMYILSRVGKNMTARSVTPHGKGEERAEFDNKRANSD